MLKYSLGTLFFLVAAAGLGCAAFVNFSQRWVEIMVAAVLILLALALVTALVGRGNARNFACGFAAVGGLYFLLAFLMAPNLREERLPTGRAIDWLYGVQQKAKARSRPETPATDTDYGEMYEGEADSGGYGAGGYVGDMMDAEPFQPAADSGGYGADMGMGGVGSSMMGSQSSGMGMGMPAGPVVYSAPRELKDIGHCLWALIFGLVGGTLAQALGRAKRGNDTSIREGPPSLPRGQVSSRDIRSMEGVRINAPSTKRTGVKGALMDARLDVIG